MNREGILRNSLCDRSFAPFVGPFSNCRVGYFWWEEVLSDPLSAAAGAAAVGGILGGGGCYLESSTGRRIDVIDRYRLCLSVEFLVNQELDSVLVESLIGFFWLIQSQTQRGTRSPASCHHDPDSAPGVFLFEKLLDHLHCFLCCLKHRSLLFLSSG